MSTGTVLDEIITGVRADMAARMVRTTPSRLEAAIASMGPTIDPRPCLRSAESVRVIAEVKRSSPSKGALAEIPDPAAQARAYEQGGAGAVSVLTEQRRFGGSLDDLVAVRAAVAVPVLRKDFVVDPYQVLEARAAGADLVLLIVAALGDARLRALYDQAIALGLLPLVEVHTPEEARRAADLGAELIGVNNRDLRTLDVDLAQFERLVGLLPDRTIKVCESGIGSVADVVRVRDAGADTVLVGEMLVRSGDPAVAVRAMMEATR
ncbi:indole-3-glycerol phosphate synthase TrpC [Propionibacterium australiense]|uniref:Indole-3-glycerol phosphate synthase n=1 Tax=Propionibacterium australiense TaxID=119981 RepID=A0A383S2H9_9ACTN|nr:indole-3-glycerol phosphate synthase TrpC [Propionibacterium australiense]RLP11490.1 indole-3-glycerol phosphate synthase TrpC [Propionibacterium australiense]RLP12774.1 indole-3-glycerol phosphate synthase TrpC [Propionibacterium australiense]SYZ32190.1 indole-3-glycerol-phosphate synthase [Propionibacterium australiense]VEH90715.1 Indole-3-glycerol phosphate synthase [Propionibacterium australiense]